MSQKHVACPCQFQHSVPLVKLTQYCDIRKIPSFLKNCSTLKAGLPLRHMKTVRPWWGAELI